MTLRHSFMLLYRLVLIFVTVSWLVFQLVSSLKCNICRMLLLALWSGLENTSMYLLFSDLYIGFQFSIASVSRYSWPSTRHSMGALLVILQIYFPCMNLPGIFVLPHSIFLLYLEPTLWTVETLHSKCVALNFGMTYQQTFVPLPLLKLSKPN